MAALQLLNRPPRKNDEWSETYYARLARANGLTRVWVWDHESVRRAITSATPREMDERPRMSWIERKTRAPKVPLMGYHLPKSVARGRFSDIWYCSECMRASPHVRSHWRLLHFSVCWHHGRVLTGNLAEDSVTQRYKRDGVQHLADLERGAAPIDSPIADEVTCALARSIWSPLIEAEGSSEPSNIEVSQLALCLLAGLIVDGVRVPNRTPCNRLSHALQFAEKAQWLHERRIGVVPTEDGLHRLLENLAQNCTLWFIVYGLTKLLGELAAPNVGIPSGLVAKLLDHAKQLRSSTSETAPRRSAALFSKTPRYSARIGIRSAAKSLGINYKLMVSLVEIGVFSSARKMQGEISLSIDRSELCARQRIIHELAGYEEIERTYGLSANACLLFVQSGLLRAIGLGGHPLFLHSELRSLHQRLEDCARPMPTDSVRLAPLIGPPQNALRWMHPLAPACVQLALAGRLPIYKDLRLWGFHKFVADFSQAGLCADLSRAQEDPVPAPIQLSLMP